MRVDYRKSGKLGSSHKFSNRATVILGPMHIPDGFLSTPVWASLGAVSLPTVGVLARKAQGLEEHGRAPLLGVMGAFVFAAQMVNFPVAAGTSSHLLGGALLACSVGPAAGVVVMTAVLAIQAFVFQDGGILALGANIFNLAIAGVLSAYLPYYFWGAGRYRKAAIFSGAVLSVLVSAGLALLQILMSGVPIAMPLVRLSAGLFVVSALIEGFITLAILQAIERINPQWIQRPARANNRVLTAVAVMALILSCAGFVVASNRPDTLEAFAEQLGLSSAAAPMLSPLADYKLATIQSSDLAQASAGLIGLTMVYFVCVLVGRYISQRRST
jgi:cobalt/nickel transport system permease protein